MSGGETRFNPEISAAIRNRDLPTFQDLLAQEPEQIEAFTPFAGGTWLHYAAREGDIRAVQSLLDLGIDVNVGDSREGRAAICDACLGGHEEIVSALLSAGSRLDTSEPVRNPLFAAILGASLPIVRLLLKHGIDAKVCYNGQTMRNMDAVAFALERGEGSIAEEISRWNQKAQRTA